MTPPRPPSLTSKKQALLMTGCYEIFYLTLSFCLAERFGQWSVEGEILRSILRLFSIAVLLYYFLRCFHQTPTPKTTKGRSPRQLLFFIIIVLLLGFALIDSNADGETLSWQLTFAVSGLLAGIREELLYRGILQRSLQNKYGAVWALSFSGTLFTLSHWQSLYHLQIYTLIMITLAGVIFSSLFIFFGNVFVNVLVHGFYDALLSVKITPYMLHPQIAIFVLFLIAMLSLLLIKPELKRRENSSITCK